MEGALDSVAWWIIAALAGQSYRQRQRMKALEAAVLARDQVIRDLRAELEKERDDSNTILGELERALKAYE